MMTRKTVRLISFFAAAVLTAVGFAVAERRRAERYEYQLENEYARAMYELHEGLNNISVLLEKTTYSSTSTRFNAMAAELYGEAELSKTALSRLPLENGIDTVNRFLSQVGNYSLSIAKTMILGDDITPEQQKNLELLYQTSTAVAQAVSEAQPVFDSLDGWAREVEQKLAGTGGESLAVSLTELEENLTDYPTLIYDGPYSDHILEKTPLMTANAPECTVKQAAENLLKLLPDETGIDYDGTVEGKIPAYRFSNGSLTATVSKKGGYVVYMRKNRAVGDAVLDAGQARDKAERFLERENAVTGNMTATYYYTDEGVCVFNFAHLDGQTVCYTDLIKVGVATDNGEIMLYEAGGFLSNHTNRAFESAKVSPETARQSLNKNLTVLSQKVALIPTDGGGEKRCYEFLCRGREERKLLVYIDVLSGEEEQILLLSESDGGTLVK